MHKISQRWKLGLSLALITAFMWGFLPIALKVLFKVMDPWTITFYRFIGAALLMWIYLAARKQLPSFSTFNKTNIKLMIICIVGLCVNYILFVKGLELTNASTSQVLIQLAPMLLMFGGLFIFRENFSLLQWIGFVLFVIGLLLFFNYKLVEIFTKTNQYAAGVTYIFIAAITWAAYALAQKQLLKDFPAITIIFMILAIGSILFAPLSQWDQLFKLSLSELGFLLFAVINTAVAYGCFAEALNHWEASRVSAVMTLTPVITVISLEILSAYYPQFMVAEELSNLTLIGIFIVVFGSALTALGKSKKPVN